VDIRERNTHSPPCGKGFPVPYGDGSSSTLDYLASVPTRVTTSVVTRTSACLGEATRYSVRVFILGEDVEMYLERVLIQWLLHGNHHTTPGDQSIGRGLEVVHSFPLVRPFNEVPNTWVKAV
jgi:hypothetical protein